MKTIKEYLDSNSTTNITTPELTANKLTTIGKLFFASLLTSMATGQKTPFRISGDPKKMQALIKVIQSTKAFQDEIKRPGATVDSVMQKLNQKNIDAKTFENVFKAKWPI